MRNNSYLIIALILAGLLIGGSLWVSNPLPGTQPSYKNHLEGLVDSGKQIVPQKPEHAYQLFDTGFKIAKGHDDSAYMAIFSSNRGVAQFYQGNFKRGLNDFKYSYHLCKTALPDSLKLRYKISNNIAVIYDKTNRKDSALDYYQKALTLAEKAKIEDSKGGVWMNMGNLFQSKNQYEISINHYLKALRYYKRKDTLSLNRVRTYENIGAAYSGLSQPKVGLEYLQKGYNDIRDSLLPQLKANLHSNKAEAYYRMDSLSRAKHYNNKAIAIHKGVKDSLSYYQAQKRKIRISLKKGNPRKALQEAAIASSLKEKGNYNQGQSGLALLKAKCHYQLRNLQQALEYGKAEVRQAKDQSDTVHLQKSYQLLAKIYKDQGQLDSALKAYEGSQKFQKAILAAQKGKYVEDLRSHMAFQQQRQQIQILEQKNKIQSLQARRRQNMIYGLGGGITLLMVAAGFLIKLNQSRKKANRSLQHQKQVVQEKNQDLEKANEEIRKASKAQSDFITMVSHEIRTPINGLMGMTELLQDTNLNKEQQNYLQTIRSSSNSLLTVINDVLDLKRTEDGRLVINPHSFDLRNIIHDIDLLMRPVSERKGLNLYVNVDPQVPSELFGDSDRLRQMLINLIGNAMKFTEKGYVELTVEQEEDKETKNNTRWIAFRIKDTGKGIDKETQQRIFNEFEQGQSDENAKYGLGLGLSICKTLSKKMNGRVELSSEPNVGSCFTLHLPLEVVQKSNTRSNIDQSVFSEGSEKSQGKLAEELPLKILIAEDDQINQEVITRFLDKLGYQPTVVNDGIAAVEKVRHGFKPDLILMDIKMPKKDGVTATKEILEYYTKECRPVVVALTADALEGSEEYYRRSGMHDYLTKPLNVSQLKSLIQKWGLQQTN